MKLNIISKFLYKLLFLTFILLFSVVLERMSIINLNAIKKEIRRNINYIEMVKKVNGEFQLIDLQDEVINVVEETSIIESDNVTKYMINESKVYAKTLGSVIKITKDNDLYSVYILDEFNNELVYSHLTSHSSLGL